MTNERLRQSIEQLTKDTAAERVAKVAEERAAFAAVVEAAGRAIAAEFGAIIAGQSRSDFDTAVAKTGKALAARGLEIREKPNTKET